VATQEPVSRRERPAKSPLSREAIVDAAMVVLVAEGMAKVYMRRLAAELDTGPASLYVYLRNTADLNGALIDRLLAELDVAWDGVEPWRDRLHRLVDDYRAVLMRYPELAESAVVVWPDGPHYLDVVELLLQLLAAGGVADGTAGAAVDLLMQHATAQAAEWSVRDAQGVQSIGDLATTLRAADPGRHPALVRLGPEMMMSGEPQQRSRWMLEVLLRGILASPTIDG
jgi:AcrR family transcriptional regulator